MIVTGLILGIAILAAAWWLRRALVPPAGARDEAIAMLQSQINASTQQSAQQVEALRQGLQSAIQTLSGEVSRALSDSTHSVGSRLDAATRVMGDVKQSLGQLEESSRRIVELGKDISSLQEILQPPKLRGSLGELFLADLLAQVLPPSRFALQHKFRSGDVVDAVVMLSMGMVPIDAKFPLENFKRVIGAPDDDSRRAARRAFVRDVRVHIDAISSKYICVDEGTFDFALMYIPAENVYYETIVKDDEFGGEQALFTYALRKRVIPVSPNSFYAYLQTVILGLKGMRIEEGAREIMEGLSRLYKEFTTFSETFRVLGQHLENSGKKYDEAAKRFSRIESRMEQMESLAHDLDAPGASALAPPEPPADPR